MIPFTVIPAAMGIMDKNTRKQRFLNAVNVFFISILLKSILDDIIFIA